MTVENMVEGCMGLINLEFQGKIDKEVARKVIDELNTFILENFANAINYEEEISTLSLRTEGMEEQQNIQEEQINTLGEQQTIQEEQLMETMLAMTAMYETIGVTMSMLANSGKELNEFDKHMVKIYTMLVLKGYKTLNEVPSILQDAIKEKIKKG